MSTIATKKAPSQGIDLNAAKKENQKVLNNIRAKADKLLLDMDDLMEKMKTKPESVISNN